MAKTFKARYVTEATGQTINNEINKATDFVSGANESATGVKKPEAGVGENAVTAVAAPSQSIVKAGAAEASMPRNPTIDDATKVDTTLKNDRINSTKNSSRTPFNAPITEAENIINGINIDSRIPGKFDNGLTKRLKNVGLNIGISKTDLSTAANASKAGEKNVTTGTKSSLGLGRSDTTRNAKDGLKTAQSVPGTNEIKKTMTTESFIASLLKINILIEEYTNNDVQQSGKIPGNRDQTSKFQGVQPGFHQKAAGEQDQRMNAVTDDKARIRAGNRAATMPEPDTDSAMEKTGGIHMQRSSIVHGADEQNAQTRAAAEERRQAQAQEGQ